MKVSDAMRLADEMRLPDLRGKFIEDDLSRWIGELPPCCAIGGASVASRSFEFRSRDTINRLTEESKISAEDVQRCDDGQNFHTATGSPCPGCCPLASDYRFFTRWGMTQHLYDDHEWSRTQIADWLDSLDAEAQP